MMTHVWLVPVTGVAHIIAVEIIKTSDFNLQIYLILLNKANFTRFFV